MVAIAFETDTFPNTSDAGEFIREFITTPNGIVVISLFSTYGVYILSAILYLDPWHLITSFVQYILMTFAYINILNVYAFCNWHDLSWGTKGSDKADALPSGKVIKKEDKGVVYTELISYELSQADIDSKFEGVVKRALKSYVKKVRRDEDITIDDSYRTFRTNLILLWIVS